MTPDLPSPSVPGANASPNRLPARLPALDGLRGIAALLILFGHLVSMGLPAAYGTPLWFLDRALWLNASGVDLFFVLSGFLIGGILIDHRDSPNLLRVFWLRRAARILPLFALLLVVFAWLRDFPRPPLLGSNTQPLWAHALFLSNIWTAITERWDGSFLANTWSLAIEEQFYLVLPFVVLAVAPRQLSRWALAIIAAAPVLRVIAWSCSTGDLSFSAHHLMPCRADALAAGLFLATAARQPQPFWQRIPLRRIALAGAIPTLVLVWLTSRNEWMGSLIYCAVGYSACALFYGWCLTLSIASTRCAAVFAWRPLAWVGRHSYFIYLFQGIVTAALWRVTSHWIPVTQLHRGWMLLVSVGTIFACAAISMRWFEAPLLRWGRRHTFAPAPRSPEPLIAATLSPAAT